MLTKEQAKAKILADFYAEFPETAPRPTGGPRTDAGKQRICLNAYKHGLTGQIHTFTAEEHEAFEKHCQSVIEALAPIGTLEQQLAQSIAEGKWRLDRASAIESGIFALGQSREFDEPVAQALTKAKTWLADSKQIQLLALYEQRIQRSIERNMAELRTLRAERLAARQQAVEEAILIAQLAKSKGETYKLPAEIPSGQFVFSNSEIEPLIVRKQLLDEARALPKTNINPGPGRQMPAAA